MICQSSRDFLEVVTPGNIWELLGPWSDSFEEEGKLREAQCLRWCSLHGKEPTAHVYNHESFVKHPWIWNSYIDDVINWDTAKVDKSIVPSRLMTALTDHIGNTTKYYGRYYRDYKEAWQAMLEAWTEELAR